VIVPDFEGKELHRTVVVVVDEDERLCSNVFVKSASCRCRSMSVLRSLRATTLEAAPLFEFRGVFPKPVETVIYIRGRTGKNANEIVCFLRIGTWIFGYSIDP
jgi:hypothetical protein